MYIFIYIYIYIYIYVYISFIVIYTYRNAFIYKSKMLLRENSIVSANTNSCCSTSVSIKKTFNRKMPLNLQEYLLFQHLVLLIQHPVLLQ